MNFQLQKVLFLRLLLPFLAGIILQEKILVGKKIILPLLIVFIILLFFSMAVKFAGHYHWNKIFGILVYGILFLFGMNLTEITAPAFRIENFRIGKIILIPEEKEKTCKIVLGRIKEKNSGLWYAVDGKILVYIEKTSRISNLEPGDWLIFHSSLQVIEGPANPMEFDFGMYCKNLGIYWKTYLKDQKWVKLSKNADFFSLSEAELIRMKMIRFMEKNDLLHESLIHSILLGYREGLSNAQQKYFAASGAMHILSVSGLHVGIIYGMLVFIIRFFFRRRSGSMLLLPLLVIWIYALITGMTPSVSRSSLMITLYVISKFVNRQTESLNIILFSGFIMILAEPSVIHQVSFQLSFAAVTGISVVFKGLYRIMKTGYWFPDQVIAITCLSIAAQLFTFPISMYYFHQFPNYFLITNLFAIPLSSLILITGFIFWIFFFNTTVSSLLAVILDKLAGLLDRLTEVFGTLPFSSTVVHIGIYELIIVYSIIFSLVIYFQTRRIISLYLVMIGTLLICVHACLDKFLQTTHKEIVVLSVEGTTAINLTSGSHNMVLTDDTSLVSRSQIGFHCVNYWNSNDLEDPEFIYIRSDINLCYADKELYMSGYQIDGMIFLQFHDTKIGILSECYRKGRKAETSVKLDLLIINAICPIDMVALAVDIKPDYVVIDRQVPPWNAEKIEMACVQYGIPFHNVYRKGYLMLKL